MTTYRIVLICDPYDENDVKGRRGVVEKFRHDGFHSNECQNDGQQRGRRKCYYGVRLQHLEQINDEHEDLVMRVSEKHRDRNGEDNHDESRGEVRRPRHPHGHEPVVLPRHHVPHIAFVVFVFSELLDRCNENVVVTQEFLEK